MPRTATDEFAADSESRLITLAGRTTVTKFCRQAGRLREALHPESISTRHQKAVRERGVLLNPAYDGMAWLAAYLPVEDAAGIYHRVDTAARNMQGPDEPRTLTQLRADVLIDALTGAGPGSVGETHPERATGDSFARSQAEAPGEGNQSGEGNQFWGVQAKVFVTVPVLTLMGGDVPG
ncbi:DUF222 domain-containing protein [Arthrobacter sp. HLT1-21]